MTSSDSAKAAAMLADFLSFTLARARPHETEVSGLCPGGARFVWHGEGLLEFDPPRMRRAGNVMPLPSVVVSAGVHGDETAPIELVSRLVADIATGTLPLACRLLVVLGNVDAMRAGRRYLDDDMNRLFCGRHAALRASREAARAGAIEAATQRFFEAAEPVGEAERWHLDMHTAIRASVFEQFALLPHTDDARPQALMAWLAQARIAAVLLHTARSTTYSQYTAQAFGAAACTLELGKVMPFGRNDPACFVSVERAVYGLLAQRRPAADDAPAPRMFMVVDQITKQSDAFELFLQADVPNFTPVAKGTLLAVDGAYRYVVSRDEQRIVFPNPGVKAGLRAGLIVAETHDDGGSTKRRATASERPDEPFGN